MYRAAPTRSQIIIALVVVIINNNINDVYFGEHFILSDRIILSR